MLVVMNRRPRRKKFQAASGQMEKNKYCFPDPARTQHAVMEITGGE
jgi:hypothetical protein